MRRDEPVARYNACNNPKASELYSESYDVVAIRVLRGEPETADPREDFLFTDPSIFGGFYSAFVRAVAAAHPQYRPSESVSIGTVELVKRFQTPA